MVRMNELAAFLKAHDDFVIMAHTYPDGDAAGTSIGLCLALKAMGKRACVAMPGGLPTTFSVFEYTVPVVASGELPFEPRTAFAVDISEHSRMGDACKYFDSCPAKAMLDHHETNAGGGDVCFIDGSAASCGELAVELIGELGVELSREMATWLYIAICTDCGRFGYSSTKPETMYAAAKCLAAGIDVDMIHREIYRTRSEGKTRLLGLALSEMQLNADKTVCWCSLTKDMYDRAGALPEDRDGLVNYLLEIKGVQVACLAEERSAGVTKFSLRSKPPVDVGNGVCAPLGGGGHACAAGITLDMPLQQALETVLRQIEVALKK